MITHLIPPTTRSARLTVALALVLGAVAAGPVHAGELTLEDAIVQALSQSPRLMAVRAEARAARLQAQSASLSRLPRVEAELGASRTDHPVYVFGSLLAQERFGPSNFGTFDPQQGAFDLSILNTPDPVSNWRAAISVHQPIWTGGAITSGLNAARAQADAADQNAQRTSQATAFDAERAFRMALLSEERVAVLRASLGTARAQAARVESLWAEGLALQSDRQALVAHVREMEATVAGAAADSAEARGVLGLVLGAQGPIEDKLQQPGEHGGSSAPLLSEAIDTATERGDVRAAHEQWRAANAMRGVARAELLPAMEVMAGTEHNSQDFFGEGGNQWMVGLGARWRLDAGAPGRVRSASARAQAARQAYEMTSRNAAREARAAYERFNAAQLQAAALDAAVAASQESFRLVEERHREGLVTTLELTQSQDALTRTRLGAAAARTDRALALAALKLAAGTLISAEESR